MWVPFCCVNFQWNLQGQVSFGSCSMFLVKGHSLELGLVMIEFEHCLTLAEGIVFFLCRVSEEVVVLPAELVHAFLRCESL